MFAVAPDYKARTRNEASANVKFLARLGLKQLEISIRSP
jgi:hypothetical protein